MLNLKMMSGGPISDWPPDHVAPVQFMIRRMTVDLTGGDIQLSYSWRTKPVLAPPAQCFTEGLSTLLAGPQASNPNDVPEPHPLDIPIRRPTAMFLEVEPAATSRFDVTFSEKFAALSIGGDTNDKGGRYGGLSYIDDNGTLSGRFIPGCRRIMFLAHPKAEPASRSINYHVCFTNAAQQKFELIIDPEVKNPGNGGDL